MTTDINVLADTLDCMADLCEDTHGAPMRTFRDSASSLRSLRAESDALAAKLRALEEQKPAFWYLPAEDEDGEDALLDACRDGTSPAVGALPLYAHPVPASQDDARDAERYRTCRSVVMFDDNDPLAVEMDNLPQVTTLDEFDAQTDQLTAILAAKKENKP